MLPSVFGTPEMFVPVVDIYRERWESTGRDWADARVGACAHVYVGDTSQGARQQWEPYYRNYWGFVGGLIGSDGMWPPFDFDTLLAGPAICGSAAEVTDRLHTWKNLFGLDRHLSMFDLGGMDEATMMGNLERFGEHVLPEFATA